MDDKTNLMLLTLDGYNPTAGVFVANVWNVVNELSDAELGDIVRTMMNRDVIANEPFENDERAHMRIAWSYLWDNHERACEYLDFIEHQYDDVIDMVWDAVAENRRRNRENENGEKTDD